MKKNSLKKLVIGLRGHELQLILMIFNTCRLKCQMSLGSNEGQVGHYDQGQNSAAIKGRAELLPRHRGQL